MMTAAALGTVSVRFLAAVNGCTVGYSQQRR
jgi:hypothetical protein